ncbi:MAG: HNH endonuclease signature motif containing protein [Ilumatobacter sp.]|uniref:HNH endonuclease n=1 Tax=Ilumatobacter sp. TaxID=1967498 RepID=UPI00329A2A4C
MPTISVTSTGVDALVDDVAGHLNAQHGRLIDVTIWLLANKQEWQGDGVWTPAQYLAWRAGVSPTTASNLVKVAERSHEFPVAIEKVRRGEMSLDQLMPIVRTVPGWADAQVTSLAHKLTVSQIRRLVSETNWAWMPGPMPDQGPDPGPIDEEAAPGSRVERHDGPARSDDADEAEPNQNRVNYGFGENGRWYLHADLDTDLGAQIHQSLDEARDALFRDRNHAQTARPGNSDPSVEDDEGSEHDHSVARADGDTPGEVGVEHDPNVLVPVSDAEAFVEIARRAMDGIESQDRRDRFRVNLFLQIDGTIGTTEHITLPDSLRDLLTCDGRIDPIFVNGATPVSIGRTSRVIPERLRRTVLHRDHGCCQVPGCTATRGLDLHHVVHWSRGGPTDSSNLITVCSRHHRMHHRKRLGITGDADDPDSLVFTNHHGLPIRASGASPTPPGGPPPSIDGTYEHPIGERLDRRWVTFVDPNIPLCERHPHPGIAG